MGKHDFVYFFQEGVKNMASHRLMSVTAITMTVGCLLIMGTFTLVAVNAAMNLSISPTLTKSWRMWTMTGRNSRRVRWRNAC